MVLKIGPVTIITIIINPTANSPKSQTEKSIRKMHLEMTWKGSDMKFAGISWAFLVSSIPLALFPIILPVLGLGYRNR